MGMLSKFRGDAPSRPLTLEDLLRASAPERAAVGARLEVLQTERRAARRVDRRGREDPCHLRG